MRIYIRDIRRKGRDSNPRDLSVSRFPNDPICPLWHPSDENYMGGQIGVNLSFDVCLPPQSKIEFVGIFRNSNKQKGVNAPWLLSR